MSKEKREKKNPEEMLSISMIKKIFEEMFEEQQNNISKLIEKNMKVFTDEIKTLKNEIKEMKTYVANEVKTIKKENQDLKNSIEMQEEIFEKKISILTDENESKSKEMERLYNKQRIQEDRSRRNNVRLDGVRENENENWDETERKMKETLASHGIDISNFAIERAHRIGKNNDGRPRTIVAKFLHFKDKQYVLYNSRKLKNSGIFLNEDFSKETNAIRKELSVKMWEKRREGKFAYISYDRLVVRN